MPRNKGFTLIELLVALVLLALIVTAAAPLMQLNAKRHKEEELRKSLWQIRDAIDAYKQAADEGLIKKEIDDNGYPPNLQILVTGVESIKDAKTRKIYFLRRLPRDPFADDNSLKNDETWAKRSYENSFESGFDASTTNNDVYDVASKLSEIGLNNQAYSSW